MARLALFTQNLRGGGAERVTVRLAGELVRRGHEVDLVLCEAVGEYMTDVPAGVRVIDFRQPRTMASAPAFFGYLRRERPDAVLAALSQPCTIAAWARRFNRIRTVLAIHSTLSQEAANAKTLRMRLMPWFARTFFRSADRIVACSGGVADDYRNFVGVESHKLDVIYNPVLSADVQSLAAQPPEHPWLATKSGPVLVSAGRLTEQKNFPLLIEAFDRIRDRTDARLIIFGEGELRDSLSTEFARRGLTDRIDLPGYVANPYAHFAAADAFVLSSDWEGLPTVLIEALACGAPVVATDCPSGPREILRGGKLGRLVPLGDADALSKAILQVLEEGRRPIAESEIEPYLAETAARRYEEALLG